MASRVRASPVDLRATELSERPPSMIFATLERWRRPLQGRSKAEANRCRSARRLEADDDALVLLERLLGDVDDLRDLGRHAEVFKEALVAAPEVAPERAAALRHARELLGVLPGLERILQVAHRHHF